MRVAVLLMTFGWLTGFSSRSMALPIDEVCQARARAKLREHFPVSLEEPASIVEIERGQLKYVFGENYCIYTAFFANETCEKVVRTREQCI